MSREHPESERTKKPARARAALTVAGLDPSGGAGITADLRGFRAAGVWGASVCAVLTVQSTKGLVEAHAVPAQVVRASAVQCLVDLDVRAMKSGALGSEENVRAVAEQVACTAQPDAAAAARHDRRHSRQRQLRIVASITHVAFLPNGTCAPRCGVLPPRSIIDTPRRG